MMYQQKLGSFMDPIEVMDSDDDSQDFFSSAFIDLSQGDKPICQMTSTLHKPDVTNSNCPGPSSVTSPQPTSGEPLTPPNLRQLTVADRHHIPHGFKHWAEQHLSLASSPKSFLHIEGARLIGVEPQFVSDREYNTNISEVMDGRTQRDVRHAQEHSSQTLQDNLSRRQTRRVEKIRGGPPEPDRLENLEAVSDPASKIPAKICPLSSAVEDILRSVETEMGEEHAAYVNEKLRDALRTSRELQAGHPVYNDLADPFANMKPLDDRHRDARSLDQVSNMDKKRSSSIAGESRRIERLPPYKHYTAITRSFLVPDRAKLHFEPYLGHDVDDKEVASGKWLERLKTLYIPPEDPGASRQREKISRLKRYLPKILKRLDLDREDVTSYMIKTGLVALGPPKSTVERFLVAFKDIFEVEIEQLFPEYDEHFEVLRKTRKNLGNPEELRDSNPVKDLLQPHLMSCPVCHVYLCGLHGVYEFDSSEDEDEVTDKIEKCSKDYADMNLTYEGIIDRQKGRSARSNPPSDTIYNGEPCGSECFTKMSSSDEKSAQWISDEETYLQALFLGMENEPRAACILAPLTGRPCYDVRRILTRLTQEAREQGLEQPPKGGKLDWYDNKRKKIRVDLDWGKKTNTHLHHKSRQPTGCEHLGRSCFDAGEDCSCRAEGVLCDKFCSCPDDCYMKFTGCNCPRGNFPCSQESEKCPCKLLNRECDPDLCHSCGAAQIVNPFNVDKDSSHESCCNTDIQRGIHKRLLVGESSHPDNIGFGAYTAEPIKTGEFIAEYVGEIISDAECGRRSEIYSKLNISFIFDLNDEVAIDSYRYGNLTRFINHSKKNANCKPCVRLVTGDHRIGFFATKDLDAGVELFFDYGPKFTPKQALKEMDTVSKGIFGVASKKEEKTSNDLKNGAKGMGNVTTGVENGPADEDNNRFHEELFGPDWAYTCPDDDREDEYVEKMKEDHSLVRSSKRPRRNIPKPKRYTR